jgi:hypothetical protein
MFHLIQELFGQTLRPAGDARERMAECNDDKHGNPPTGSPWRAAIAKAIDETQIRPGRSAL